MTPNECVIEGTTARLSLTNRQGQVIAHSLIDTEDAERVLSTGRWRKGHGGYVYTFREDQASGQREDVALHRFLLNPPVGMVVDHINHDPLDNRRSNLRILTKAENMQNRRGPATGKRDPFRNVYRQPKGNGFAVRVSGRYFGTYPSLEEADIVARQARQEVMAYSTN